jgi:uncharacterized protein (DUF58 family)
VGAGSGAAAGVSAQRAGTFRLVPQRRFVGVGVGEHRSRRRGAGDEVAGARPYRPGDRRTWIDWRASARLSAARGTDEFVVREFFADTAPRAVVVVDRRPRMGLHDSSFPWLDKGATSDAAVSLIGRSVAAERGDLAFVADRGGRPVWVSPRSPQAVLDQVERQGMAAFGAGPRSLDGCLRLLAQHASALPAGSFVFVLSDFVEAVSPRMWRTLRARHWDVTPVVIQDPTWEQSFPDVGGVLLPVGDVATRTVRDVWMRRREARERATANEDRLETLLAGFRHLGFDPVVLGSSDPGQIARCFARWSERRMRLRRRSA